MIHEGTENICLFGLKVLIYLAIPDDMKVNVVSKQILHKLRSIPGSRGK